MMTNANTPLTSGLAAATAVLLAGCATTPQDPFGLADSDGDGLLSRSEFERAMLEAIYTEADSNGDSRVTFAEWRVLNPDAVETRFAELDTDGDGAVSPAEARAFTRGKGTMNELFAKIDTDGSGSLTRDELKAFYARATVAAAGTPTN